MASGGAATTKGDELKKVLEDEKNVYLPAKASSQDAALLDQLYGAAEKSTLAKWKADETKTAYDQAKEKTATLKAASPVQQSAIDAAVKEEKNLKKESKDAKKESDEAEKAFDAAKSDCQKKGESPSVKMAAKTVGKLVDELDNDTGERKKEERTFSDKGGNAPMLVRTHDEQIERGVRRYEKFAQTLGLTDAEKSKIQDLCQAMSDYKQAAWRAEHAATEARLSGSSPEKENTKKIAEQDYLEKKQIYEDQLKVCQESSSKKLQAASKVVDNTLKRIDQKERMADIFEKNLGFQKDGKALGEMNEGELMAEILAKLIAMLLLLLMGGKMKYDSYQSDKEMANLAKPQGALTAAPAPPVPGGAPVAAPAAPAASSPSPAGINLGGGGAAPAVAAAATAPPQAQPSASGGQPPSPSAPGGQPPSPSVLGQPAPNALGGLSQTQTVSPQFALGKKTSGEQKKPAPLKKSKSTSDLPGSAGGVGKLKK